MDTQDREKYRQLRQQQRERQLHIIRLSILLGVGVILMFTGPSDLRSSAETDCHFR